MRVYLDLLRAPHAARLLGGTLLGRLPNGMGVLAIMLFTRAEGGSFALAGLLAAVHGLAAGVGQPVLGRLMDRLGQPRVLLTSALLAGLGFVLFAVTGIGSVPAALATVSLAGFFTPPLEPGLRALWPDVLKEPGQVQAAYAMDAATQELLFTLGPVLVIASKLISGSAPLYVCALLGLAGTLVVTLSRPSRAWRGRPSAGDWVGALRSPGLVVLSVSLAFIGLSLGVFNVGMVAYAEGVGVKAAGGWLIAVNALGALTGGLVYGARSWPGRPERRIPPLLAGLTLGYALLLLMPSLPWMVVLSYVSGIFLAPTLACVFGLVDGLAPEGTVTEAFAWIVAFMTVGVSAGSALAGKVQDEAGTLAALSGAAAGGLAAVLVCVAGGLFLAARSPARA
ncbi:MFS transporter [Actinocorallia sp. API 0066]|uniref:MFS transporter n=1 Tax=Actinocorallia sp. API 0066 TaxID=2896846 RepID=UPI001E6242CF|nr:MFS transporter [Actinocorallia sp. API 0066]MCD0451977.1 MFS transporter [Actinocorallia sp. API 0066]